MKRFLRDLDKQPKEVRNAVAFWIAAGITSVIAVFWVVSLPGQIDKITGQPTVAESEPDGAIVRAWRDMRANAAASLGIGEEDEPSAAPSTEVPSAPQLQSAHDMQINRGSESGATPPSASPNRSDREIKTGTSSSRATSSIQ